MISKCGQLRVHHWAHTAGSDCDPWHEGPGPWHREWQDCVQVEHVEVVMGPHIADIVGFGNCVIELQHSPISVDDIAAHEEFYRNMVWVFDATERFEMITVGRRTFFAFGRTKHIEVCTKPVFLDFGTVLVEVEAFSNAVAYVDGFGRTRSREWFAERYLSDRLQGGATPRSSRSHGQCRWSKHERYKRTSNPSRWNDPEKNISAIIPKDSVHIPFIYQFRQPPVNEWERIVNEHPQVANGWTKDELTDMKQLLNGELMILDGFLRLMPSPPDEIQVERTALEMRACLDRVDEHIAVGRIPILKDTTKQQLLEKAEAYEKRRYGEVW